MQATLNMNEALGAYTLDEHEKQKQWKRETERERQGNRER